VGWVIHCSRKWRGFSFGAVGLVGQSRGHMCVRIDALFGRPIAIVTTVTCYSYSRTSPPSRPHFLLRFSSLLTPSSITLKSAPWHPQLVLYILFCTSFLFFTKSKKRTSVAFLYSQPLTLYIHIQSASRSPSTSKFSWSFVHSFILISSCLYSPITTRHSHPLSNLTKTVGSNPRISSVTFVSHAPSLHEFFVQ
jgi:hypothetical protein